MIKGLYFKLNIDNAKDQVIHAFFNNTKRVGKTKIEMLYDLIWFWCQHHNYKGD